MPRCGPEDGRTRPHGSRTTETLETTVHILNFPTKWTSGSADTAVAETECVNIAGWQIRVLLGKNNDKGRFYIGRVSDDKCPLQLAYFNADCGGRRCGLNAPLVMPPEWTSSHYAFGLKDVDAVTNEERLLSAADKNTGTLHISISLMVVRPSVRIDHASCLRIAPTVSLAIYDNPCMVTIKGDAGCQIVMPKLLACHHSAVFEAALTSDMLEGKSQVIQMQGASQQSLEDFRDCLICGGLSTSLVTGWQRLANLLVLADKYAVTPLASACTFYLSMSVSRDNAAELLTLADHCALPALRRATMNFVMRSSKNFEAVLNSEHYDAFSSDLLREFWAYGSVRKAKESEALPPLDGQWGEVIYEFPDSTNWKGLSRDALRRACFERHLATTGTAAELLVRLPGHGFSDNTSDDDDGIDC